MSSVRFTLTHTGLVLVVLASVSALQARAEDGFPLGQFSVAGNTMGSTVVISTDWDFWKQPSGPYLAALSPWGGTGASHTTVITLNTGTFPNGTQMTWSWPNTPDLNIHYGSDLIQYGYYATSGPTPTVVPPAKQLKSINTLQISYNVSIGGNTKGFDVIFDMYLTTTPDGATPDMEIEIVVHQPSTYSSWAQGLPRASNTVTDNQGTQWVVVRNVNGHPAINGMIIFSPANFSDLLNHTVDLKALFLAAVQAGYLTGNEYFNGFVLANEATSGSGSMTVNSLSVNYN